MDALNNEALIRIVRQMKKQNNYEKWETLHSLSGKLHFKVDFKRLTFISLPVGEDLNDTFDDGMDEDGCECSLPLSNMFSTLFKDGILYILLYNSFYMGLM